MGMNVDDAVDYPARLRAMANGGEMNPHDLALAARKIERLAAEVERLTPKKMTLEPNAASEGKAINVKCKYCESEATKTLVWLLDKHRRPARIKLPWCGCDLMNALRKTWACPYPVCEGKDYAVLTLGELGEWPRPPKAKDAP